MFRVSPSTLSLLEECPRCFWLQLVEGVSRPAGIFPSLPGGIDGLLKKYFDGFRAKDALPPELSEIHAKLFPDLEKLNEWRNNRKGLLFTDEKLGIELKGVVDELLEKDGKLIVLDFKTRGYPLKEDSAHYYFDQMALYTLLLRENGFKTEDYAYLLFYHPRHIKPSGNFEFQADLVKVDLDLKHARQLLEKAAKVLKQTKPPESSEECEYCKWKTRTR